MSVCCECCVLSGRGLWDELITRPEESLPTVCVCTSVIVKPTGAAGPWGKKKVTVGCVYSIGRY
jgi:hypothetical protein